MTRRHHATAAALACLALAPAAAQERLIDTRTASANVLVDHVSFGSQGLLMEAAGGRGRVRVKSATQITLPVSVAMAFGDRWTFDIGTAFTTGEASFDRRSLPNAS